MRSSILVLATLACAAGCTKSRETATPDDAAPASVSDDPAGEGVATSETGPEAESSHVEHFLETEGPIGKSQVESVADEHHGAITTCFEDALRRMASTDLTGQILIEFTIGPDGKVAGDPVSKPTKFHDPVTTQCLIADVRTWSFAKNRKNASTKVVYPFSIRNY